mgnify:CR=1 FL=1
MENVSNFKFDTRTDMMAFLKGLKPKDHFRIAKDHGLKPSTKEEANLLTDYLVQGANNGLTGDALIQYAKDRAARLVAIMPHLAGSNAIPATDAPVAPDARAEADQGAVEARPTEAPTVSDAPEAPVKATKAPTTRTRKVSKVKHPDGTIVPRPDRGGFEGWYAGKAEAFRPTVEKVQQFFARKYPDVTTVVVE